MDYSNFFFIAFGGAVFIAFIPMYYRIYLLLKIKKSEININHSVFSVLSKHEFLLVAFGLLPYFLKGGTNEKERGLINRHNKALSSFWILVFISFLFLGISLIME